MDITPEALGAAAVGLVIILGAIGNYLRSKEKQRTDPVMAGIIGGWGDRDQTERIIGHLARIADATEAMADERQNEMSETLKELVDKIDKQDHRGEQEEQRPRRHPQHRR